MAVAQLPLTVPDAVCFQDLDPLGRDCTSDLEVLAQDVYHVLLETLGSNLDDINRGLGVEKLLSAPVSRLGGLARRAETELLKDSRIDTCSATVTQDDGGGYVLAIAMGVDGSVVGLSASLTPSGGLELLGWTVDGVTQ